MLIFSKFSKFLHSTSLFFRVASIVLISVMLVSLLTAIITIHISENVFFDTFSKSNYKVLTQISENFMVLNDKVINIMNTVENSSDFERYLTQADMDSRLTYKTIYNMQRSINKTIPENDFNDITLVIIGLNGKTYVENGDYLTTTETDILSSDITKNALDNTKTVLYQYLDHGFTSATKYNSAIIATKVLCNKYTKQPYGFAYVIIGQNSLKKYYDHFVGNANSISILSNDNTIISSNIVSQIGTANLELNNISKSALNSNSTYINTKLNSNSVAILAKHLPTYNFNLVGIIDKNIVLDEMYKTSDIMMLSLIIALIFIVITFFIIQRTTKPLSVLANKMPQIIHGDFNNYISVSGSYEVRRLSSAFNYMLDGLNNYVAQQIKLQKEKRKAEIHALQMQINPHFIYNTLSSIKWLMWKGNTEKSIETIDAFISLLQNTISNKNEMITVLEEIDNSRNYALINHIRYGDSINVNFFVIPQCEEYIIPKLILQPFIENAFFHAFTDQTKGYIHVFVNQNDGNLICEIIDNGKGIASEDMKNLLVKSTRKHEHFTSIGIHNVDDRIKLLYGDEYGVTITSEIDKGTTVRVIIPAQKEFTEY